MNEELNGTLCELFNNKFLVTTIIIMLLSFITNMLNDGFTHIVSLTLDKVNDFDIDKPNEVLQNARIVLKLQPKFFTKLN